MKLIEATRKTTTISFILFFTNAMVLMFAGKLLVAYTTLPKLDFQLSGYTVQKVISLFKSYGEAGRETYFWLTILDIPFPFLVAFFGYCYFTYTWKKWSYKWISILLISVSFSFCVFDMIENVLIFEMLSTFPHLNEFHVNISSVSTQLKLYSLFIVYSALPITFLVSIFNLLRKKASERRKGNE